MVVGGIIVCILAVAVIGIFAFLRQPSFGKLPSGERLERIRRSPNYQGGQFRNLQSTAMMTGKKSRWQALWEFVVSDRSGLYPEKPVPSVKTDLKQLPRTENLMVWFGHSSYLLLMDGKRFLVDPVFHAASPVPFINRPFSGTDIYKPEDMPDIDYLVITHDHWDHLDYRTVKALKDRIGKVVCPLGVGEHFEHWGYRKEQLIELDWEEKAAPESGVTIHCLPTRHFSGRGLTANQTLWASFLLETSSLSVFIGGDGGYGTHFAQIASQHPDIDWAILENGQYSGDWKYIHTMPDELARVARDLKAQHIVTVHHSKFALSKHTWDEPLRNEEQLRQDSVDIATIVIGGLINLGKHNLEQ